MKLIVETDLGHDIDDFIALCYLISAGVELKLIMITPGSDDQVAVAKFLLDQCGLCVPVGSAEPGRASCGVGGIHAQLLARYGCPAQVACDGKGTDLMHSTLIEHPDSELFVCGPPKNCGDYFAAHSTAPSRATIQGGYISYETIESLGIPFVKLDKYVGQTFVPSFNPNGNRRGMRLLLDAKIDKRRFVSKNICHTVTYGPSEHANICSVPPRTRAGALLREAMELYLAKKRTMSDGTPYPGKKLHDPTAAVCHVHPEIATWVRGDLIARGGGWGTIPSNGGQSEITATIDYTAFWNHLTQGT